MQDSSDSHRASSKVTAAITMEQAWTPEVQQTVSQCQSVTPCSPIAGHPSLDTLEPRPTTLSGNVPSVALLHGWTGSPNLRKCHLCDLIISPASQIVRTWCRAPPGALGKGRVLGSVGPNRIGNGSAKLSTTSWRTRRPRKRSHGRSRSALNCVPRCGQSVSRFLCCVAGSVVLLHPFRAVK